MPWMPSGSGSASIPQLSPNKRSRPPVEDLIFCVDCNEPINIDDDNAAWAICGECQGNLCFECMQKECVVCNELGEQGLAYLSSSVSCCEGCMAFCDMCDNHHRLISSYNKEDTNEIRKDAEEKTKESQQKNQRRNPITITSMTHRMCMPNHSHYCTPMSRSQRLVKATGDYRQQKELELGKANIELAKIKNLVKELTEDVEDARQQERTARIQVEAEQSKKMPAKSQDNSIDTKKDHPPSSKESSDLSETSRRGDDHKEMSTGETAVSKASDNEDVAGDTKQSPSQTHVASAPKPASASASAPESAADD